MKRLKRSLSLRSSRRHIPESSRPQVWENDSYKVRNGGVSFPVKYAGAIEVTESRGTQVCAEAFRRMRDAGAQKRKRMTLLVTSDCIRVVDEETKSLVIDQTIEKVSFCTPDPSDDRVFSYICREGTTRRWMCHCFIATRDTGERLSHAVGCAFTACLQRKQKAQALQAQAVKDKDGVQEGQAATSTTTATTTTPTSSTGAAVTPPPQQATLKQIAATATAPTSTSPAITGSSPSMNGPTPVAAPQQQPQQLQQQPQPQQVMTTQQTSPVQPVLKPPPAVARTRPQPFAPSPFTRHMSLRYKSTPMSMGPLKDNVKGYEALHEESQAPKLPQTVDALIAGTTTPQQPSNYPGGFAPQGGSSTGIAQNAPVYNGFQSTSTTMNTSYGTPVQNVASPAQPFGGQPASPWTPTSQLQRTPSDAERWLESAEKLNKVNGSNQGLLTTVNPFSAAPTQNNGISGAWTQDMNASLPAAAQQTQANAWGKTSIPTVPEEDEFASLATRHTGSPLSSPAPTNPFSHGSQVYWV